MIGIKFKRTKRPRRRLADDYVQPAYDALNALVDRQVKSFMTKTQLKLDAAKQKALLEAARSAVVDEAGELEKMLAPFKGDIRRLEELRKTIRSWYAAADPTKIFSAYGETYVATIGACGNETVIHDMSSIYEAAGKDKFFAACKLAIGKLPELVDPALAAACTSQEQTGSRGLALMPIRAAK